MRLGGLGVGWIVVGFFSILAPSSSSAAAAANADELIRQGVTLRRSGDDEGALRRFEEAFKIEPTPTVLVQIGLAEQALGRWALAYEHIHRAVDTGADPWIKKNRAAINDALKSINDHVGQLEILGASPDAEVRINGKSYGKLPLAHPIPLSTGTVTIDLAAPGFVAVQRTTVVRARGTVRESFDALVPIPTPRSKPPAPPAPMVAASLGDASEPRGASVGAAPEDIAQQADRGSPKAGSFRTKVKWLAWGMGVVGAGIGVFGYVRQNQAGTDFSNGCGIDASQTVVALPGSGKNASDCRSLKTKVDSNYNLELAGLVGAGALAATGLVLWLTEPAPARGETAALTCRPGITPGRGPWLGCRVAF
jgi:hypothetical protein